MKAQRLVSALSFLLVVSFNITLAQADVESLYKDNCSSCHGGSLEGGSASALISDKWGESQADAMMAAVIAEGKIEEGMPAWKSKLSEIEIRSLVIFVNEANKKSALGDWREAKVDVSEAFEALGHRFRLQEVFSAEGTLWAMDELPDGNLIASFKEGAMYRIDPSNMQSKKIKGLPVFKELGQGGLLDVFVLPDSGSKPWVYISYADVRSQSGSKKATTKITRFRLDHHKAKQVETIWKAPETDYSSRKYHFGSRFAFDGTSLYFSIGDRGQRSSAQDLNSANGKILRIFPDGSIPDDNPYVGVDGALPEIWTLGHRNPQGLVFDFENSVLYSTEHGPRGGDELNRIVRGKNYGWPRTTYGMNYNGTPISAETQAEGVEDPLYYWVPSIAPAGIDIYRGSQFSKWTDSILISGMAAKLFALVPLDDDGVFQPKDIVRGLGRVRDVKVSETGDVYVNANGGSPMQGKIYKLINLDSGS